jgi:nucleoside-diphosphate-sugar epimerase
MDLQGLKILVTGGTGFIGASLVKTLLGAGAVVRSFDNDSRGSRERLAPMLGQVDLRHGDIRDPGSVEAAAEGVDAVCHLAFVNGTEFFYSQPELVLDVGVKGITNVLDACRTHRIRRFILASSSEVYQSPAIIPTPEEVPLVVPDPLNARYSYGGGKIISELMAVNYGRSLFDELFIFRPHNVYGPFMGWEHVIPQFALRMAQLVAAQPHGPLQFSIQGTGEETRAFCYIDDFAAGFLGMLRGPSGIYNIGTDVETSIRELVKLVAGCFGREVVITPGPLQAGSTKRRCPDITKLRALGFTPRVELSPGVRSTVEWYRQNAWRAPATEGES